MRTLITESLWDYAIIVALDHLEFMEHGKTFTVWLAIKTSVVFDKHTWFNYINSLRSIFTGKTHKIISTNQTASIQLVKIGKQSPRGTSATCTVYL